jgi:CheY-like chemotaxis protein
MSLQKFQTAPTILVVEDYADSREMLRLLLESLGYRVITAENGSEALALAATDHLDLVVTDFALPDVNGVTLVNGLRSLNSQLRRIPIIMLTALHGDEYHRLAIQAGCTGFLTKPPDFDKLQSMIERLLSRHESQYGSPTLIQ